jgi:uncharacterized protein
MTENPQDQPTEGGQQPYPGQPSSGEPYSGQPAPPPPPPPQAPAYGQSNYAQAPVSPSDARMWAMFAALGGIVIYFVAPLVIYLMYKDRDPFIRRHAAQAMNFQIIIGIIEIVSIPLWIVLIGFATTFLAGLAFYIFSILAAIAANRGEPYDYPFIPQMIT